MMASVAALADEYGISCQVSLEERMACGIGVCLVCACKIKRGDEQGPNISVAVPKTGFQCGGG